MAVLPASLSRFASLLLVGYLTVQWIFLSSCVILYNKALISGGFGWPLTLVLCHMAFGTCAAASWKALGWEQVPSVSIRDWATGLLPVGVCFAGSLALSNMAYKYISVAYIQMIKASTPIVVLLMSFCFGIEKPSCALAFFIVLIATGVTISCVAQVENSVAGTALQITALLCEGLRLCLVKLLVESKGLKLSAIANLYYIAPTCFMCLLGPWAMIEAPLVLADGAAVLRNVGFFVLASNSSVAFLLNLATLALISKTSPLTLNVAGVVKDLILILWSVFVQGALVGPVQYVGYAIAFSGVTGYTAYRRRLAAAQATPAAKQAEGNPLLSRGSQAEEDEELELATDDEDGDGPTRR